MYNAGFGPAVQENSTGRPRRLAVICRFEAGFAGLESPVLLTAYDGVVPEPESLTVQLRRSS
jgi:hypothetical protein